MNTIEKQLKDMSRTVHFDSTRKKQVRDTIEQRVLASVREPIPARHHSKWAFPFVSINLSRPMGISSVLIIIVALTGGTSFAAQGALPGDILYPVKVSINEEVRAAVTLDAEAKARYEARRAEVRLQEGAELAARQRALAGEERSKLEARFRASSEAVRERVMSLAGEGRADVAVSVASELEAGIRAQEKVLARVNADIRIRAAAQEEGDAALRARQEAEAQLRTQAQADTSAARTSAQSRVNMAVETVSDVRAYIGRQSVRLGADATVRAEAALDAADATLQAAQSQLTAEAYTEAHVQANAAVRAAIEARSLVEEQFRLEIDLNLGGSSPRPTPESTAAPERMDGSGGEVRSETQAETDGGSIRIEGDAELRFGF